MPSRRAAGNGAPGAAAGLTHFPICPRRQPWHTASVAGADEARPHGRSSNKPGEQTMITRRAALTAGLASAVAGRFSSARAADTPGVTATEIKIGNTMPYSGPASSYSVIGRTEAAYLQDGQRAGRRRRPQDQLHFARRRLQPAQDRGGRPPTGRGRPGGFLLPEPRHAEQLGDRHLYEPEARCRSFSSAPAPASGATTRSTRGPWAGSPTTAPKPRSTRSTCWRT